MLETMLFVMVMQDGASLCVSFPVVAVSGFSIA